MKNKINKIEKESNFEELLKSKYRNLGSKEINKFEEGAQKFYVSEMLKQARKEAKLTQSDLAERIGTKKSYISRVENGKGNITLETLIKIFETGLNKKVGIHIG